MIVCSVILCSRVTSGRGERWGGNVECYVGGYGCYGDGAMGTGLWGRSYGDVMGGTGCVVESWRLHVCLGRSVCLS